MNFPCLRRRAFALVVRRRVLVPRSLRLPNSSRCSLSNRSCSLFSDLQDTSRLPHRSFSSSAAQLEDEGSFSSFTGLQDGPSMELGFGSLANQTYSSVVGTSGSTVLLTTVARNEQPSMRANPFFTVEYRQRHHAVGEIPKLRSRQDNTMPQPSEVLASRAVDRALRPLIKETDKPVHFHIHCSVQACELWGDEDEPISDITQARADSGHPVSLAINTAAAAFAEHLVEPVAATVLALMPDGTLIQDPTPWQIKHSHGELLYAGTRQHAVMMEWSSHELGTGLREEAWQDLLAFAHATIQPLLDTVEELREMKRTVVGDISQDEESLLRASLGLAPVLHVEEEPTTVAKPVNERLRQKSMEEAIRYCEERLGDSLQRFFGYFNDAKTTAGKNGSVYVAYIHHGSNLLSKTFRGRRQQIVQEEVARLLDDYLDTFNIEGENWDEGDDAWIHEKVFDILMKRAFIFTSTEYGSRADSRGPVGQGWKTVRPLRMQVPSLPMAVHGSASFARGDTQVLCTATLGAPREGLPHSDPYKPATNPRAVADTVASPSTSYATYPVGSLRFLRTQEALVSDLNSRRVLADKERTGDSGSLAEVNRAFLQYDFPAYSTGDVPTGSAMHNRRAIGHGALAERAILPVLPPAHAFPYAIRMTAEVTDSNGSSSMATVCGATLALLDAGVPIAGPVAGVSVGLAYNDDDEDPDKYRLLLDITGTEDHYGAMDFKIAGTGNGVTALQLDVKRPLPTNILLEALELARAGRRVILDEMASQCKQSLGGLVARPEPKESAPRAEVVRFDPARKRDLVGPGGVVLRQLEDRYGVSLDLTQEGQCLLFGSNREMVSKAKSTVMDLVADVEEGEVYEGTIVEIRDFGAIVELLRNKEGILHVSELADHDARNRPEGNLGLVKNYLHVGQKIKVLCTGVDPVQGTIRLSRKALFKDANK